MQETQVQSLGWADPLEKEIATHSSILVWETLWTEEPGGLLSTWSQRVWHDLVTKEQQQHMKDLDLFLSLSYKDACVEFIFFGCIFKFNGSEDNTFASWAQWSNFSG